MNISEQLKQVNALINITGDLEKATQIIEQLSENYDIKISLEKKFEDKGVMKSVLIDEGYAPAMAKRAADMSATVVEARDWINQSGYNSQRSENWKIFVKMITGAQYEFSVFSTCTVGQLKSAIFAQEGIMSERQRLVWNSIMLFDDGKRLSEYGLIDGETVNLMPLILD